MNWLISAWHIWHSIIEVSGFGLAGLLLAWEAHSRMKAENAKTQQAWHAKPEALKAAGGIAQANYVAPETTQRFSTLQELVRIQRQGLLKDKKIMCIVSEFNLQEVLGMAELAAGALAELGHPELSRGIETAVRREFDQVFRLAEAAQNARNQQVPAIEGVPINMGKPV